MRNSATIYFLAQSFAVVSWWVILFNVPSALSYFFPREWHERVSTLFVLPDALVIVVGSSMTAILAGRYPKVAGVVGLVTAGGLLYATLICVPWLISDRLWLGPALMMSATAVSLTLSTRMALQ